LVGLSSEKVSCSLVWPSPQITGENLAFRHAGGRLLDLSERGEKGGEKKRKRKKKERGKKGGKVAPSLQSSSPLPSSSSLVRSISKSLLL
jgi:hypothetical protein